MNLEEAKKIISQDVGYSIANQLKTNSMLSQDLVIESLTAALKGKHTEIDQAKVAEAGKLLQAEAIKLAKAEGDDFISANKEKEGVQVTDSGLQYIVHEAGEGDSPSATDKVTVHYEGKLVSGKIFDSSIKRGTPAQFGVNQVIPGWVEGLQLMKPGAKFTFFIPQELGYGERGSGRSIPPFSALIFEVELISIA